MKNHKKALILFAITLLAGACILPDNPELVLNINSGAFEAASELFEEAGEEGGLTTVRFHTNDNRYWSEYGHTVLTVWGEEHEKPFTERTIIMSKPKGFASACYGALICHALRNVEGKDTETMLCVMINNEGQYALGKVIGGRYEALLNLTFSPYLNTGAGAPNKMRLTYEAGLFSLYFNGAFVQTFNDANEPVHFAGRNGYVVVIAPYDKFPEGEVDVYFTEQR